MRLKILRGADPVEGARHCALLDGFGVHLPPRL